MTSNNPVADDVAEILRIIRPNPAAPKKYLIYAREPDTITMDAKITTEKNRVGILESQLERLDKMGWKIGYIVGDKGHLVLKFKRIKEQS